VSENDMFKKNFAAEFIHLKVENKILSRFFHVFDPK